MVSSSLGYAAGERRRLGACGPAASLTYGATVSEPPIKLGPACPGCGEPWLRPTAVPAHYRCVYCLQRYELVSVCPNCGEHSTIVRMSTTAIVACNHCQGSMLRAV
jgi:zinc-ribbons